MRRDYDRVRQLRTHRAAGGYPEDSGSSGFAGLSGAAFPIRHCGRSFFVPGTRPARVLLTLRASATGCAFMFCAANLPARSSLASSSAGSLPTLISFLMTKFLFKALIAMLVVTGSHHALAQTATPTASATASDVAALREQVQALTETVKALQQQVKDQETLLEKANIAGNQSQQTEGTSSTAAPVPTA